nr:hypothetical protein 2 [Alphaproteobacteria bacterium]
MAEGTPKKKPGNKGRRASAALSRWRTLQIYQELKKLRPSTELVQKFSKEWDITERQVYYYIKKANDSIKQDLDIDRQELILKLLHAYNHVYNQALDTKQLSNALGALNGIGRLSRVDPATYKHS